VRARAAFFVALLSIWPAQTIHGQGLAGASVTGTVTDQSSGSTKLITAAVVTLTNTATGNVWRAVTSERGTFRFDDLPVGGPFMLAVRAIGYHQTLLTGVVLHAGDRVTADVILDHVQARTLDAVVVGARGAREERGRRAGKFIPGDVARRLPLLDRRFVGLLALSPWTSGNPPLSIGGQHSRFNAIQVDGAAASDFFGVNVTPGGGAGAASLSLEAIDELHILIAPFDVRQGGFSGGLINAVTRSGTNHFQTSGFASLARSDLVGLDTAGAATQRFSSVQYGMTAGGPIVPNRVHYFAAAEVQARSSPAVSTVDVNQAVAARAAQISRDVYGFDPGGIDTPNLRQPSWNVFTKLSWQVSPRHLIDVSVNSVNGSSDVLGRSIADRSNRDGWALSASGVVNTSSATTLRARAASIFGGFTNEGIIGYSVLSDDRDSRLRVPLFLIQSDVTKAYVAAGSVTNATGTFTHQRIVELTDNLSWSRGSHVLTVGTQNHLLHFRDNLFVGSWGVWAFSSADAYEQRQPARYEITLPVRPGGPLAAYSVAEASAYAQDRWSALRRLTLTVGVRVDAPFFDRPFRNDSLAADATLGHIDTAVFPSGNSVLSPRVGFSYDVGGGRNSWVLRGGVGAFAGHPPYAWMTNAYSGTGMEQTRLVCESADGVPAPVTDIAALPRSCLRSSGTSAPVPTVTTFGPHTRFQEAIKLDLGVEHELGSGYVGSLDVVHTTTRNTLTIIDRNLAAPVVSGEGRLMYGTIAAGGIARPMRIDGTHFGPVYDFENRSGDRETSIATEIHRDWSSGAFVQLGYAWSRTEDLMSLLGTSSGIMFQNNPLDGSIADRRLRLSNRDVPQSVVAAAVVPLALSTTVSFVFRAHSGAPYAYLVGGDANAEGTSGNDLVYIPRDAHDITLVAPDSFPNLDAFIQQEACLRTQRGRVMSRNSCRNASVQTLDVRLAKSVRGLEISADVFNVPNLLDRNWGLVRETTNKEGVPLLSVVGWDAAANRPVYNVTLPSRNRVVPDASRWRVQLGARFSP
jgi:hypothetical protein